jgi:hypothetical protein
MPPHTPRPTGTPQQGSHGWQRWWMMWSVAAVVAIGLALATSHPVQAKTFHCGAGDVACLIAAINDANANGQKNTIRLEAGTYTLTAVDNNIEGANGLPSVTSALTITGKGATRTVIERAAGAPEFRLLHIDTGGNLRCNGLTLQGGDAEFDSIGGSGILNRGALTVTQSILANNGVNSVSGGGGAIRSDGGTVTLATSTLIGNGGSGLRNYNGTVVITESTIVRNGGREGGGIANLLFNGTVAITNSTIARNSAFPFGGGGIENSGTVIITNSTIAANSAGDFGGGIHGQAYLQNTILAGNTARLGADCIGGPVTSLGSNLIGDLTGCTITLYPSDLTGDPGLDAFIDSDRPGKGHFPLLPTSQAIDAGNDAVCPRRDQLGQRRMGPCDIGAIEFQDRDDHDQDDRHDEEDARATTQEPQ